MNRSSNGFLPVVYGFKPTVVYGSVPITYALLVIERMRTDANQSSDGSAPTIYARSVIERTRTNANRSSNGFAPTIHALSVLECTRTYANRSSNRFTSPIYDFSHCRVFYSTLRGQDTLRDEVQPYASRSSNGFAPSEYDFCTCRVPLRDEDTLRDEVRHYALNLRADHYQTTVDTVHGYVGLASTYLRSSTENEREIVVPSPTRTPTVVQIHEPTVLKSPQLRKFPDFGFYNANSIPKKFYLRDLILLDNQSTADTFCNKKLLKDVHITESIFKELQAKMDHPSVHDPKDIVSGNLIFNLPVSLNSSPVSAEAEGSSYQAKSARELQAKPGDLRLYHLKAIESVNPIPSIPISIADIDRAEKVYHPSLHDLSATVSGNFISYVPVSIADIDRNEKVSDPSLPISMGQLPILSQSDCIHASDFILAELPCALVPKFKVPLLASNSGHTKFTIVEPIKSRALSLTSDVYHDLMWLNAYPPKGGVSPNVSPEASF